MWVPKRTRPLAKPDAALIERGYDDLLFYDFPILFTGFNSLNQRVVGSFVENVKKFESYLHSVVDEKAFSSFIRRDSRYPHLLEQAYYLFLVHWTGEKAPTVYPINYADIPAAYKPDQSAFCPSISIPPSFEYEAKLNGGLADQHQALPETLSKFQNKVAALIRIPFDLKPLTKFITRVLLQAPSLSDANAYGYGSLKVKYHVEFAEKTNTLFHESDDYSRFLTNYLSYCLNDLPTDAPNLVENRLEPSQRFHELLHEYEVMTGQAGGDSYVQRRKELENNLLEAARKLEGISSIVRDEFKDLVLSSVSKSGELPLGVLDTQVDDKLSQSLIEVDKRSGKVVIKDDDVNTYSIHIYDLNTDTRKGKALMHNPSEPSKKLMKPSITILGEQPLPQTKYTESLHFDTFIEVQGRATKVNELIRHIDIEFEET